MLSSGKIAANGPGSLLIAVAAAMVAVFSAKG
jgi:hypothetical protein